MGFFRGYLRCRLRNLKAGAFEEPHRFQLQRPLRRRLRAALGRIGPPQRQGVHGGARRLSPSKHTARCHGNRAALPPPPTPAEAGQGGAKGWRRGRGLSSACRLLLLSPPLAEKGPTKGFVGNGCREPALGQRNKEPPAPGSPLGYPRGLERSLLWPAHAGFLFSGLSRSLIWASGSVVQVTREAGAAWAWGARGRGWPPVFVAREEVTTRRPLLSPPSGPSRGKQTVSRPEHPRHEAQLLSAPEGLQPQLLVSPPAECYLGVAFPFAPAQPEGGESPSSQLDHDPVLPPGTLV